MVFHGEATEDTFSMFLQLFGQSVQKIFTVSLTILDSANETKAVINMILN